MSVSCKTNRIAAYIDGELDHHETHLFEHHVESCASCRDELRAHLTAKGVGTEIYYPVPLHAQRCFAYLEHEPNDFPHAQRAAAEVLALPIYPELTAEQREYVVREIASFVRG